MMMQVVSFTPGSRIFVAQLLLLLLAALTTNPVFANEPVSTEVIRWDRKPIRLSIDVNRERLLQFPAAIQPGVPPAVAQKVRLQAIDDTLYITATEPFAYERFQVRELGSGRIYLIDIKAEAGGGQSHPVQIINSASNNKGKSTVTGQPEQPGVSPSYGYMELTRYAAKRVYAPARLTEGLPGVTRVPLGRHDTTTQLVAGAGIDALPLASWRASHKRTNLYISAVRLTNTTPGRLLLDPRRIRGDWRTATFQHTYLEPEGNAADTTAVYLISDRPFHEALPPWLK